MKKALAKQDKPDLVIVTGISGSGKSTALKAFEDTGYFCVDNLPAVLIGQFVDLFLQPADKGAVLSRQHYALLVDCRDAQAVALVRQALKRLKDGGVDVSLLFMECQDEQVAQRFRETRRPHPLLQGGANLHSIGEALQLERELLADLRAVADRVIDTSNYNPHELRRFVEEQAQHQRQLNISVLSFGYKYGVPQDVDLLVDVRFIPNPHYVKELKAHTGLELKVADFVFATPEAQEFISRYLTLLEFLLPHYLREGKRYLTIALGCTAGRHRSVAIAQALAKILQDKGHSTAVTHRDIARVA